jgi:hypothetical protein
MTGMVCDVPEPPKYRAFLSYSHRDTRAVARLHARLERYRPGKDLAGRDTPLGPVPASLRPVFRDRSEFGAGGPREALDCRTAGGFRCATGIGTESVGSPVRCANIGRSTQNKPTAE